MIAALDRELIGLEDFPDHLHEPSPEELRVRALRELLGARPVLTGEIPRWLRLRIEERFGPAPMGASAGEILRHACRQLGQGGAWLDHWGTRWEGDAEHLVSEPYAVEARQFAEAEQFAEALGLRLTIDPASYHFPGKTIRLWLSQPAEERERKAVAA